MPTRRVSLGTLELNVALDGAGEPLVLVHGFPLTHAMWHAQSRALADRFWVIAPDLRGFGGSSVTRGIVTMEQMADDLAALLETLDVRTPVTLAGLSMGGYVVWEFWKRHRARVRRLILCDTRAAADTAEAAGNRRALAERALTEGPQAVVNAFLPRLVSPSTTDEQPELIAALTEMMMSAPREGLAAALRGMAQRVDATPWLPDINVPTLFIVGEDDAISTPIETQAMAAAVPGARYVEIPGAGHLSPWESPEAVTAAFREFLQ